MINSFTPARKAVATMASNAEFSRDSAIVVSPIDVAIDSENATINVIHALIICCFCVVFIIILILLIISPALLQCTASLSMNTV